MANAIVVCAGNDLLDRSINRQELREEVARWRQRGARAVIWYDRNTDQDLKKFLGKAPTTGAGDDRQYWRDCEGHWGKMGAMWYKDATTDWWWKEEESSSSSTTAASVTSSEEHEL